MSLMSMRDARPFKQAFLKNLLLGLKSGGVSSRDMSFEERKDAIRRAADAALASARGGAPCWSRSLAAAALARRPGKNSASCRLLDAPPRSPVKWRPGKAMISKKILRRSLRWRPRSAAASGGALATAMVRKRTRVLKAIVPGGEVLDECSLLGETLDYAMSLKAQVDVMQLLVRALQSTPKPYSCSTEEAAVGRD